MTDQQTVPMDDFDDFDDDGGLPDAAFTEDELAAGVQHIMRGNSRTRQGATGSTEPAADRAKPPEVKNLFRHDWNPKLQKFDGQLDKNLEQLPSLLQHVKKLQGYVSGGQKPSALSRAAFAEDLERLTNSEALECRADLSAYLLYERQGLERYRRVARNKSSELIVGVVAALEAAISMLDERLTNHAGSRKEARELADWKRKKEEEQRYENAAMRAHKVRMAGRALLGPVSSWEEISLSSQRHLIADAEIVAKDPSITLAELTKLYQERLVAWGDTDNSDLGVPDDTLQSIEERVLEELKAALNESSLGPPVAPNTAV